MNHELAARSFAQGVCKKVEYFQIFSNVSHHFSNIFEYFQTFSIVFERFQKKLAHLVENFNAFA